MADTALPPLPAGFVLEDEPAAQDGMPPLPAGFVLEDSPASPDEDPGLDIDIVGGTTGDAPSEEELQRLRGGNANDSDFARMISGKPRKGGYVQQRLNELGEFVGEHGGRQVLQGIGGTLDMLGGHAFSQFVEKPLGLSQGESYRDKMAGISDRAGFPVPSTPQERIVSDVGEALSGTGLTMGIGGGLNALAGAGRPALARIGNFLTAQPGLQAVSTATGAGAASTARESGASGSQQALAGIVGGLSPGAASALTGATVRGLVRGRSGENMLATIGDFRELGANPSVGQASGSRTLQGVENLLSGGPTSSGVMNRFAERQADDIGTGLQALGERVSRNASGERAGRAIERGVETLRGNIGATKRALYWQADRLIPDTTQVPLTNTWQAVVRLTTPTQGATATTGQLINPRITQLRQGLEQDLAAGNGQIPYAALKRIRTDIGEAIAGASPLNPPTDLREMKQLYASLSRDMEAAAAAQGPQAVRAARRANNYTRASADRLEQVQRIVDKNGGPEKVYAAALSGTRDGGTTLRAVMQSLPPEGQKAVTGAVIKRMGLANPGQQDAAGEAFSAQTFLTNWNKVSPEAKRALFDRYGPGFSADMDRVARVAQNIRDGAKVYANPSGTANRAAALTYGASLVASLFDPSFVSTGALVGGGISANLASKILTNPRIVRTLANSTKAPVGAAPGIVQAMRVIARDEDDAEIDAFADQMMKLAEQEGRN